MTMATVRTQQELAWIHFWRRRGVFFSAGQAVHADAARPKDFLSKRAINLTFAMLGVLCAFTIGVIPGVMIGCIGLLLQENKA